MMRVFGFVFTFLMALVLMPQLSHAIKDSADDPEWSQSKPWQGNDFKPYLADQPIKNRMLWDRDTWTPELWIADAGGDERLILRDLYAGGILTQQYQNSDDIPVLEVGEPFLKLSHTDRIRVLRFIDYVFEITKEENGMFYVYYALAEDEKSLGIYDKRGFQQY
jgi:hypothetical protein